MFGRSSHSRCLSTVLAAAMIFGQLAGTPDTYPFVPWDMYSTPVFNRSIYRLIEVGASGSRTTFPFEGITPWVPGPLRTYSVPSPVLYRISVAARTCGCSAGRPDLDQLLEALSRIPTQDGGTTVELVLEANRLDARFHLTSWTPIYKWRKELRQPVIR